MNLKSMRLFKKYKVSASIVELQQRNVDGDIVPTWVTGETIEAFKYNRSAAERYFSQTWASDIADILVVYDKDSLTDDSIVDILGKRYKVDSVDDVAITGAVYLIGLRIHT